MFQTSADTTSIVADAKRSSAEATSTKENSDRSQTTAWRSYAMAAKGRRSRPKETTRAGRSSGNAAALRLARLLPLHNPATASKVATTSAPLLQRPVTAKSGGYFIRNGMFRTVRS